MDAGRVIEALRGTLVSDKQAESTKTLDEMHKIIGFTPTLLNIVLEVGLEVSVRQAAALYLKNNVSTWWKDPNKNKPLDPLFFNIHEQDRQAVRNAIVGAVVAAPLPLQAQLKIALSKIISCDYPSRFAEFPGQLKHFLSSADHNQWHGALVCLYAFVKVYEHERNDESKNTAVPMREFLPILQAALSNLINDKSEESRILQVLILKIFYAYTYCHFPLDVMSKEAIGSWNDLLRAVLSDFSTPTDDATHPTWKSKKWALRVLNRLVSRYGSPTIVIKKFRPFAEWYLKAFSSPVLSVLLGICEMYRQKSFISKPVLSQTLEHFNLALSNSFSWKILRPHFSLLVREVIFPLLAHSEEDAELWETDPIEYIRFEAVEWGRSADPPSAAYDLLGEACLKRRGVLNNIMPFCVHILTSDSTPKEKDAVLHMYGAVAEILLHKEAYKNQLEPFLLNHVIPTLHAAEGYRRARAYWLVGKLADATFTDQNVFAQLVEEIRKSIFSDPELPVRALAALCLKDLLHTQEEAKKILVPHLRELILQILELLRQTEFDDLNQVIERLMTSFEKELVPIAVELTQNMCATFMRLIQSVENGASEETNERGDEDLDDYRAVVATSVLDNIEAMLRIAEEHGDLVAQLEPIVALQIKTIFDRELSIFYEEALSLLFSLTTTKISPLMWQLFDQLYIVFQKDSSDCFSGNSTVYSVVVCDELCTTVLIFPLIFISLEMMPCLHNYMTVDRSAFIADPKHVEVIAAVCSQVVVAGILYCPSDVLAMMTEHQWPGTATPILAEFLKVWISDADVFLGLHDRRVYVLGLCLLLSLPAAQRPSVVEAFGKDYIPTLLVLFNGLKRAYAAKAQNQAESDDEEEEESDEEDIEEKALGSDEDEVDEEGASYLEMLEGESDGSVDDDDDEIDEETTLEAFDTEMDKSDCDMDEYVTFYRVMTELESGDPNWYNQLVGHLTEPQQKELKEVVNTALKCMQQKESKMIEQAGGYSFTPTIPSSFNFGANPGNQ
ncbi:Importin 7 [Fasciola gigantica]|uniref:Importin 7 n=1 Tax=Fasciola gigantica TaxID=46835 RepID=A0A504YMY3_FASGI|nr:Importin 7 [Fasciola gigantica]